MPKMNLNNAIAAIPELREAETSSDPLLRDTIRYAKMLEGNVRNTGVHACGFIIAATTYLIGCPFQQLVTKKQTRSCIALNMRDA